MVAAAFLPQPCAVMHRQVTVLVLMLFQEPAGTVKVFLKDHNVDPIESGDVEIVAVLDGAGNSVGVEHPGNDGCLLG